MTDKERLEEIEKCIKHDLIHNDGMMLSIPYGEVRWLIEQNKRYRDSIREALDELKYSDHFNAEVILSEALEESE